MCQPSYTPDDAAVATGLDISHIDAAIRSGDLRARVVGYQLVVTSRDLKKWLASQPLLVLTKVR